MRASVSSGTECGASIRAMSVVVSGVILGSGSWNTGPAAKGCPSASVSFRLRTAPSASIAWKVIDLKRAVREKKWRGSSPFCQLAASKRSHTAGTSERQPLSSQVHPPRGRIASSPVLRPVAV